MVFPDPEDPPMIQFYGMPVFHYEGVFIGLLWRLHTDPGEIGKVKWFGPIDCGLAYSYGGDSFNRVFHEAFIERNERGEHGGGCIYVSSMVVDSRNVVRFYSSGSKAEHFRNQNLKDAALMLHTMRLDGFVYLESYSTRARLTTRGLVFKSPDLRINVRAPYGCLKVQVLDESGRPVEGLTFEDAVPFTGDELFHRPLWSSGKGLEEVLNRPVFLDLELAEGKLYGLRGDFDRYWW